MTKENKNSNKQQNGNYFIADVSVNTFNTVPAPILIRFSDPITNEIFGEFKEKDGLLTFEGKVDDAGKIFVDFIFETFKQRIEHLYFH